MSCRFLLIFFLLSFVINASAEARCDKPSKPVCASNADVYKKKDAYKICQAEIESFHGVVSSYVDCLKKELEEATSETQRKIDIVSDETNSVIKEFNCKSGMEEDC